MNVVDSSGWLEYFADGPNADFFSEPIQDLESLVMPTLCLFEVFKRIAQQRGEGEALQAVAVMQQGEIVDMDLALALESARLSLESHLPMADSVILATARARGATLWTQDSDFKDLEDVSYVERRK